MSESGAGSLLGLEKLGEHPAGRVSVRAKGEPAYVLSSTPWMETSLVADILTPHYGRVGVVIRGAKRPSSRFRGIVNSFALLSVSFSGASELKNLTDAKWAGSREPKGSDGIFSAFYLNELTLRMVPREMPLPPLFESYERTLLALSEGGTAAEAALRGYEVDLLRVSGWGQAWDEDMAVREYALSGAEFVPLEKARRRNPGAAAVSPAVLRAVLVRDFSSPAVLRPARRLLREIIEFHLGGRGLVSRHALAMWQAF